MRKEEGMRKEDTARNLVRSLLLKKPKRYWIYAAPISGSKQEWMELEAPDCKPVYEIRLPVAFRSGNFDFFTHHNGDYFVISCGICGGGKGGFMSRIEAIEMLNVGLNKIGVDGYYQFIADAVASSGLSPRWQFPEEKK